MAITTNYSWSTPDDTALVKDGAAAIRTLGTSADTTVKNLNPETTLGDIAYRSSSSNVNTRLGIGSSGQVLTVAAGVPSWATPTSSPLTTKGDIFTFSTLGARLPVGTNTYILTADSAEATGLKWAAPTSSGLTLISRVPLTSSSGQNFDNVFSATYEYYKIIANLSASGADVDMKLRVAGVTTSTNYLGNRISGTGSTAAAQAGPSTSWTFGELSTGKSIMSWDIAGPFLTQQTAMIGHYGFSTNAVRVYYNAQTDATSFDGFNLTFSAAATGTVAVYGYAKA